ncbi:AAA family ATPase [Haladaptatus sp. ZSTT2]|uniref:AAA family ATPase n=1 Tax=Haladaptatus sp. ZSTT2 TaxID=3120515 RepID=UPI00300EB2E1
MNVTEASAECAAVLDGVSTAVIAERNFLESVLMGLVGQGHVLIEDVPGTGKTLTARSFAKALGLSFSRIQFTPDLLPSDVTGTHVFNEGDRTFEFTEGPIFANVVLADEINRAPPKTQAALLEAMEEKQVTVDGDTHKLPDPFFVMATQNPVEQEGTFALPEAQVDRFAVKTAIGYPNEDGEFDLLKRRAARRVQSPSVERVLTTERVRALQQAPESIHVEDDVLRYMVAISRETRADPRVRIGVSPRGTQRLFEAARARAVIVGREYVTPDDVKRIAPAVLAHRVVLTPDAKISDITKATVINDVLDEVPVPTID